MQKSSYHADIEYHTSVFPGFSSLTTDFAYQKLVPTIFEPKQVS